MLPSSIWMELPRAEQSMLCVLYVVMSRFVCGLNLEDTATLLNMDSNNETLMNKLYDTAFAIKERIYGNRIVLFAPLYIANYCANNCTYCGFRYIHCHLVYLFLHLSCLFITGAPTQR